MSDRRPASATWGPPCSGARIAAPSSRSSTPAPPAKNEKRRPDSGAPFVRVEPGGIEPPSRDSQLAASTRVSAGLISTRATAIGSLRVGPARGVFSSVLPQAAHTDQPDVYERRRIRRPAPFVQPALGRESVVVIGNYFCACFLRGQHAPRRATTGLPCPVESS